MHIHQRLSVCLLVGGLLSCAPKGEASKEAAPKNATTEFAGVLFHLPVGATFEPDKDFEDTVTGTIHLAEPRLDAFCSFYRGRLRGVSAMTEAERKGVVFFEDTMIEGQECRILAVRIAGDPQKRRMFVGYHGVGLTLSIDVPNETVFRAALATIKTLRVEKSQKQ